MFKETNRPSVASKKANREDQNERALGGLRNPWKAVDKIPGLRTIGESMRKAFDRVVGKFPSVLRLADHFGTPDIKEPDEAVLDFYRAEIRKELGCGLQLRPPVEEGTPCQIQGLLLQTWLDNASCPRWVFTVHNSISVSVKNTNTTESIENVGK